MCRACSTPKRVKKRREYKIIGRKTSRKRPLGISKRSWKYIAKMDLEEIRWEDVDWIHLVQDGD
jgi:hypothetical protein